MILWLRIVYYCLLGLATVPETWRIYILRMEKASVDLYLTCLAALSAERLPFAAPWWVGGLGSAWITSEPKHLPHAHLLSHDFLHLPQASPQKATTPVLLSFSPFLFPIPNSSFFQLSPTALTHNSLLQEPQFSCWRWKRSEPAYSRMSQQGDARMEFINWTIIWGMFTMCLLLP